MINRTFLLVFPSFASVLSVKPAFRGTFPLLANEKLCKDECFLTEEKFQSWIDGYSDFSGRKSLQDNSFELRAVSYNGELNDTEIMVAMTCDTYLTGVLAPGQHIYADGYISYGDSLNIHDHAHRSDITLDYFHGAKQNIKEVEELITSFPYIKPQKTTTDGNVSYCRYFDDFRHVVSKKLEGMAETKLAEKKQYLKELNFIMFFHCHEPFSMGKRNSLKNTIS